MQQGITQEVLTRLDAVAATLKVGVEQLVGLYTTMVVANGVVCVIWAALLTALSATLLVTARRNYRVGVGIVKTREQISDPKFWSCTRVRQVTFWDLPSSVVMLVCLIFGILFVLIAANVATFAVKYLMAPEAYAVRELMEIAL